MASNPGSKHLPKELIELIDLSIFSFGVQAGLRASDKVRGGPVIEGVCAFFGDMLKCASKETQALLESITALRLGNWRPGLPPTEKLSQLISSRIQRHKTKQLIHERHGPVVPEKIKERVDVFNESTDRVKSTFYPRCWRCQQRCRFCNLKKQPFLQRFREDLSIPFLDVMDEVLDEDVCNDGKDDAGSMSEEEQILGYEDPGFGPELYEKLKTGDHIPDSDDDEEEEEENEEGDREDQDGSISEDDDSDNRSIDVHVSESESEMDMD